MTAPIHETAAKGFRAADLYEKGRPEYPAEAIQFLCEQMEIIPGKTIVDLGAGTGKLTRLIAGTGATIVAIEPVEFMRQQFSRIVTGVPIRAGTAEEIPLADQTADGVVSGQAFHWFDGDKALCEIFRVLKPRGKLGLIWNVWDRSTPWIESLNNLLVRYENGVPRYRSGEWRQAFAKTDLFLPVAEQHFQYIHRCTPEALLDRVGSISFISVLDGMTKSRVMNEVTKLVAHSFETKDRDEIHVRYQTDVFIYSTKPKHAIPE